MLLDGGCRYGLVVSSPTPAGSTRYIWLRYYASLMRNAVIERT